MVIINVGRRGAVTKPIRQSFQVLAALCLLPTTCSALEQFTQLQTPVKLNGILTVASTSPDHIIFRLNVPTSFKGISGQPDFHFVKEIELVGPLNFQHILCGGKKTWIGSRRLGKVADTLAGRQLEVSGIPYATTKEQNAMLPVGLQLRGVEEKDCKKGK